VTGRGANYIQATTPAGSAGTAADIVVTNANGQATLKGAFSYANPPASPILSAIKNVDSSIPPTIGSFNGGTPFLISGSGFQYGAVVSFGGQPPPVGTGTLATTMAVSNSAAVCVGVPLPCIRAITPPFPSGTTDVWVTNMNPATGLIDTGSGAAKLTAAYTFVVAPSTKALSPASGTVSGGSQITITGANFQAGATVLVVLGNQSQQAAVVNPITSTSITAVMPSSTAGTAAVAVVNPDGQKSNTLIFTYQ
jgi:hypothetical protein